jgi:hypothetical protein
MIDMHVHYFPPRVFAAIWRFFEETGHGLWPIRYKVHGDEHRAVLAHEGVTRFTTLVYAHKAGLAQVLNEYVRDEAQQHSELLPFGTIYAGDGLVREVAERLFVTYGFLGIKLHPFVSNEDLDDPRFDAAYDLMQTLGRTVVCHPGSAPVYRLRSGAERLRRVLQRFPSLQVVVAHCGAFEYEDYARLADDYEHVYFDTAMNCVATEVFHHNHPGRDFFLRYQDRILFGSDFPNVPYDYDQQPAALRRLELGPEVEAKLFAANAHRLLQLPCV